MTVLYVYIRQKEYKVDDEELFTVFFANDNITYRTTRNTATL